MLFPTISQLSVQMLFGIVADISDYSLHYFIYSFYNSIDHGLQLLTSQAMNATCPRIERINICTYILGNKLSLCKQLVHFQSRRCR